MKKRYIISIITVTLGAILMLTGCNKEQENPSDSIIIYREGEEESEVKEPSSFSENQNNIESYDYENSDKIVAEGYENVDEFLEDEAINRRFQGVALVAVGDEIKFAKAYGYADFDDKRENTLKTRFAIASNTKQFTAAAVMQLVDQGLINLDDTIDKYFPEYQYGSQITVRCLLQMRSGMPDHLNEVDLFMRDEAALNILKDYEDEKYFDKYVEDKRWNSDIILNSLYKTDLAFEPNTTYDYCNTNYYLLGLIIEKASGMSYEEYIDKNIFKPLNMTTSSMKEEESDAKGHGSVDSGEIIANPDFTYAAGNIYANVFDIFRWNRALHTGQILSDKSYSEMITPIDGYGYGLFINEGIVRHSGVIDGFNSNTEYELATDTTIIVMENCDKTTDLLDAKYDTSIIRSLIPR